MLLEHKIPEIISSLGLSNAQELINSVTIVDLLQDRELHYNEVSHLTGGTLSRSNIIILTTESDLFVNIARILLVA